MKTNLCRKATLFLILAAACAAPVQAIQLRFQGLDQLFENKANWQNTAVTSDQDLVLTKTNLNQLQLTSNDVVHSLTYEADANNYTATVESNASLQVGLGGISNLSSQQQVLQASGANSNLSITGPVAGDLKIVNSGINSNVQFYGGSIADTVDFINQSTGTITIASLTSVNQIHANAATLENVGGGILALGAGFRGDNVTIHNSTGTLQLAADADLITAKVLNESKLSVANVAPVSVSIGSINGSGAVLLGAKQLSIGANNLDSDISGSISGAGGSLVKVGTGTLKLSGINSYTNGTLIQAGTLAVNNLASLPGVTIDNSNLVLGKDASGVLEGLTGSGNLITENQKLILIRPLPINPLPLPPPPPVIGGMTIGGPTQIDGTWTVTSTTITPTGILYGSGKLSGMVKNFGTVHPGPIGDVGNLTVGSYSGTGTVDIAFDGAKHSTFTVTGAAKLTGGTLKLSGTKFTGGTYTILTAGGGVQDVFANINAPLFLKYGLLYEANAVDIKLESYNFSNATTHTTANERAVAAALDAIGAASGGSSGVNSTAAATKALFSLPSGALVAQAFDEMSGDALSAFYDVNLRQGQLFTQGVMERAVPMDSAAAIMAIAPTQGPVQGDARGTPLAKASPKPRGLWARAIGDFSTVKANSDVGSPTSNANTGGFEAGYDLSVRDNTSVGLFVGYTQTGISVDDRNSSGDATAIGFGAYGRYTPGAWFFDGALAYVHNSDSMDRTIDFANQTAHSDFSSPLVTIYGDGGYTFELAHDTALEPYFGMRISHLSQGDFTETGAPGENLIVDKQTITSFVPITAVRATHLFSPESRHPFLLGGTFGLEYEMGTTDRQITAQFADGSGAPFTVYGTPQKRTAVNISVGGRLALTERWQAYMTYGLTAASQHFAQAIMGGARLKF